MFSATCKPLWPELTPCRSTSGPNPNRAKWDQELEALRVYASDGDFRRGARLPDGSTFFGAYTCAKGQWLLRVHFRVVMPNSPCVCWDERELTAGEVLNSIELMRQGKDPRPPYRGNFGDHIDPCC